MKKQNGPWTITDSQIKYSDSFVILAVDEVIRPDGEKGKYATVKLRHGVSILPIDEDGMVYLTRQFRYAVGKDSLEVVSGGIDHESDEPLEIAKKELKEEAGIEAKDWTFLGWIDMDTASVNCPVHLFLAQNLKFKEKEQESTEDIKTLKRSLSEAFQMVMDNNITHSPSCVLILKAYQHLKKV